MLGRCTEFLNLHKDFIPILLGLRRVVHCLCVMRDTLLSFAFWIIMLEWTSSPRFGLELWCYNEHNWTVSHSVSLQDSFDFETGIFWETVYTITWNSPQYDFICTRDKRMLQHGSLFCIVDRNINGHAQVLILVSCTVTMEYKQSNIL